MKFSRKIQLLEQLIDRVAEVTDDENVTEICEEILEMKKEELFELIEMSSSLDIKDEETKILCWFAYLANDNNDN